VIGEREGANGDVVFPPDFVGRVSKTGVVTEETKETGKPEEARTPEGPGSVRRRAGDR
jgi:hypothetical protein